MKLLIVSGTPKTDGITCSLVDAAFAAASDAAVQVEVVRLFDMGLGKCRMCGDGWGTCFEQSRCAFGDDDGLNAMLEKFADADAFVFVTPVYWGEVSEDMKLFFDRMRRCEATKQWKKDGAAQSALKAKPSIIVANAGGGGGGLLTCLQQMERAIIHMGGDGMPRESAGIFDIIAVNRWNQAYKRDALRAAVGAMVQAWQTK